jgi:hypothetical protein
MEVANRAAASTEVVNKEEENRGAASREEGNKAGENTAEANTTCGWPFRCF